jgi:DNA polymerase-3 subunit delta
MPTPPAKPGESPVVLICGEDEFAVAQRSRQVYQQWCAATGDVDCEIIEADAANSAEALRAIARLREALQTLPFFGSSKVIWFKNCAFLGDERTATAQAVLQGLAELAEDLSAFRWDNVRLLISCLKVDKRRTFYRTLERIGSVEVQAGLSADDRDWARQAEGFARQQLAGLRKGITEEALAELVVSVGPNLRQLHSEVEKLSLFVGNRTEVRLTDVAAVVTRNKQARAFALGDAVGDRDLPAALRTFDEAVWEAKLDRDKGLFGLLGGLVAKVRSILLAKELVQAGLLKPEPNYNRFKTQLASLSAEGWPEDRRFNPRALKDYVLFKATLQSQNYSAEELVRALDLLLTCNHRMVSSGLDEVVVLQQTLVEIVGQKAAPPPLARR